MLMSRLNVALALMAASAVVAVQCAPADASSAATQQVLLPVAPVVPDPAEAAAYANSYGVSLAVAQQRLSLENRAGPIVEQLRQALGWAYAGVWFDNSVGRYHVNVATLVPLSAAGNAANLLAAQQVVGNLQLSADTDIETVATSAEDIAVAQSVLDGSLSALEHNLELQTGPDVKADVLDLYVSTAASPADLARIDSAASATDVPTQIIMKPASYFVHFTATCTFPNCDGMAQGGTKITNSGGTCSVGYAAQGNAAPYYYYAITAGHCQTSSSSWSAYSSSGAGYTLGTMDRAIWNIDGDYARIRITHAGVIDANASAFWGINLNYATLYAGWSVEGQYGCRTGEAESQAQCGTIEQNGVTITETDQYTGQTETVAGEFDDTACVNPGDSGGPFMLNYYAVGIVTAGQTGSSGGDFCTNGGGGSWNAEVENAIVPVNLNVAIPISIS